jgi:HPt (histidine-containing phosphotransfer) domain-containing protein
MSSSPRSGVFREIEFDCVTEVIDRAALQKLLETTGGDQAFMGELVTMYLDDAIGLLAAMRQAVGDDNTAELRRAAHSLKSNSATFGALTLARLCQELEQRARDGILEGATARITEVESAYAEVARELRTLDPRC